MNVMYVSTPALANSVTPLGMPRWHQAEPGTGKTGAGADTVEPKPGLAGHRTSEAECRTSPLTSAEPGTGSLPLVEPGTGPFPSAEPRTGEAGARTSGTRTNKAEPPNPPADRPDVPELVDRFGRTARDLRVSLTDRCNLRCQYCMPPEGIDPLPGQDILTDDEVIRLVRIAVEKLGIDQLRLTGGEPLLRKGLEKIVAAASSLKTWDGRSLEVSLTTNGLGLARRAAGLKEAGLSRVNISLDAADRETYAKLTRRDRYEDALAGARASAAAGLSPVKVNAVLMPGINEHQAGQMLFQALSCGYQLRFIEHMPLGPRGAWTRQGMITAEEILAKLGDDFRLVEADAGQRGASPAEQWQVLSGRYRGREHPGGTVGVIASMTRPFCERCDRTRLTADGQIRACLFAAEETDARGLMRGGASDEDIADMWRLAMWGKQAGHGTNEPGFRQPDRPMSAIGG